MSSEQPPCLVTSSQDIPRMSVIPLTVFFSLLLAGLFIALFAHEQRRRRFTSAEHDSLLPLAEETAHPVGPVAPGTRHDTPATNISPAPRQSLSDKISR